MIRITVDIEYDEDALATFCDRIGWDFGRDHQGGIELIDGTFGEAVKSEIVNNLQDCGLFADATIEEETSED